MKSNFLEQNIEILKNNKCFSNDNIFGNLPKSDTIAVETAKNESKTFYINFLNNKLYFHSKYSPQEDAKLYIQKSYCSNCDLIFLIGLGFGYHAKELLKVINDNQKIIIIETDINIFYAALNNVDLCEIFSDTRVFFHIYQNDYLYRQFIENILDSVNCFFNKESILTLITNQYMQVYKTIIENITKLTNDTIIHLQIIRNTIIDLSRVWLKNYINNMMYLKHSISIENFFCKFQGIPAYIISAGPSLNKNILELKKVNNKGIIFSGYTALKALLDNDIVPNFVVALDGRQLNYETQEQLNNTFDIPLIYSPLVDSRLLKKHKGIKINYVISYDNYSKYINDRLNTSYKSIYAAGTIAATIIDIAYLMGCNPIVLVGQDLAFTNNKRHAHGTNYDNCIEQENIIIKKQNFVNTKDIYGQTVKTNYVFMQYKKGIEDYIYSKKYDCKFIDSTEGGAYIEGTSIIKLSEIISKYNNANKINVNSIIKNIFDSNKFKSDFYMSAVSSDMQKSFIQLQQLADLLSNVVMEFESVLQKDNYYIKDLKFIDLILDKIEICNNKIDIFNKNSKLFQMTILGIIYLIEKEYFNTNKNLNDTDFFILNSITVYRKIINLHEKFKLYF